MWPLGKHKELHLVVLNVGVLNGHSPQYNKVFHALMSSTLPFAHLIVPLSPSRSCTYSRVKYNFVPRLMRPNQNVLTYRNASYFSHSCNGCICGHLTESGITVNVVSVSTSSPTWISIFSFGTDNVSGLAGAGRESGSTTFFGVRYFILYFTTWTVSWTTIVSLRVSTESCFARSSWRSRGNALFDIVIGANGAACNWFCGVDGFIKEIINPAIMNAKLHTIVVNRFIVLITCLLFPTFILPILFSIEGLSALAN